MKTSVGLAKLNLNALAMIAATLLSTAAFARDFMPIQVTTDPPPTNSINYYPNFATIEEEQQALKQCLGHDFLSYSREDRRALWGGEIRHFIEDVPATHIDILINSQFQALEPTPQDARLASDSEYDSGDEFQHGTFEQTLRNASGQVLYVWMRYRANRTLYIDPITNEPIGTKIRCSIFSPNVNRRANGTAPRVGYLVIRNQAGRVVHSESSPRN